MKKLIVLIMTLFVVGCGSDDSGSGSSVIELTVQDGDVISSSRAKGEITSVGEVDRYLVRLNEVGRYVQIKCTSNTLRPDVDLLVNVFEQNGNGDLVMVAGDHAPEDGQGAVNLKIKTYVDEPKVLYINVRDLMDDESSHNNPYYISVSYEAPEDGNGSFSSATGLDVGGDAARDAIGAENDLDCYRIDVAQDGVYDIFVDFDRLEGSPVALQLQLFNEDGENMDLRRPGSASTTHMIHYLTAGTFYVTVTEDGKDDFDNTSMYEISVRELASGEVHVNDTPDTSTQPGGAEFAVNGSIDYYSDQDYYAITTPGTGDVQILNLTFESAAALVYLIELVDATDTDTVFFSHEYTGGANGDGQFVSMLKLVNGISCLLRIRPSSQAGVVGLCPYSLSGNVEGVTDADEVGLGNDDQDISIPLIENAAHSGRIVYSGDRDWYSATFPYNATSQQLFDVTLDVPETSNAQYIMRITGPGIVDEKIVYHSREEMRAVDLKTGILVPTGAGDAVYYIKVFDYQNNDADKDAMFTVSWDVEDVPSATPADCPKPGIADNTTLYHSENVESDLGDDDKVEMWYPSSQKASFKADNQVLDIGTPGNYIAIGADPMVLRSPWIAGYIDYDGDEDWFGLDLTQPYVDTDTQWYYQVNVEFYSEASPVEYVLEVLPDSNGNAVVNNYQLCESGALDCQSGVLASWGDTDLGLNILDWPGVGQSGYFWIGRGDITTWYGPAYIRISDFNYLKTDENTYNTQPDNDWGTDVPYYFRVTVTYHSGALQP